MLFQCRPILLCFPLMAISACDSAEPVVSTSSTSSSSSSSSGGHGGSGGSGGNGGTGGIVMDDSVLCTALTSAGMHESLVAEVDALKAPLMTGPDILYDVTLPPDGGFVAMQTLAMHTTFAIYVQGEQSFEVLLDGSPVVESVNEAVCMEAPFRRFEHHVHNPSTFVVSLPATPTNQSVVFYHLL